EQDRKSGDEGEEENLAAELLLDLVEVLLAVDSAGQVERVSSGGPDLRQHRIAQRLHFSVRLLGKPERQVCRVTRAKREANGFGRRVHRFRVLRLVGRRGNAWCPLVHRGGGRRLPEAGT